MDADAIAVLEQMLKELDLPDDLPTLLSMRERLESHILLVNGQRLSHWRMCGWTPNPPGLTCQECHAPTWSAIDGKVERIKCTNLFCGTVREVFVG